MSDQILHYLAMPGESAAYRVARNTLLTEEMPLRRQIESKVVSDKYSQRNRR